MELNLSFIGRNNREDLNIGYLNGYINGRIDSDYGDSHSDVQIDILLSNYSSTSTHCRSRINDSRRQILVSGFLIDAKDIVNAQELIYKHLSEGLKLLYSNPSQPKSTDKYTYCNHFHELTEDHEIVNLGDQDVVVNKEATILLKELNRLGLKTRSHHVGDNECFLSILLDNTSIEVRDVNERDSTRDMYNGKKELLIQWKRKKNNQAME